jgi:hypothetical protein
MSERACMACRFWANQWVQREAWKSRTPHDEDVAAMRRAWAGESRTV